MFNHILRLFFAFVLATSLPGAAFAQEDALNTPTSATETAREDTSDQENTVPESRFAFWLNQAFFRIRTAFTFQAERKAQLLQTRLSRLEQKLIRCQEAGNEQCVERLEAAMGKTQARTERFLERKAEVLEQHKQRFESWQEKHIERREAIQDKVEQRQQNTDQLIETRSKPLKDKLDATRNRVQQRQFDPSDTNLIH